MNIQARLEFQMLRQNAGLTFEEAASVAFVSERQVRRYEDITDAGSDPSPLVLEALRGAARWNESVHRVEPRQRPKREPSFRFIDLFAGIGGLRRGFEPLGGECVFTSEWDRYSQKTYRANFKCDHPIAGDITKIPLAQIPEHDVLLAGFPCQPFSIAGVSKKNALHRPHGFRCEAQGTLFFNVAEIIEYHQPQAFLLENVKNLVNHDRGRTFDVICRTLKDEMNYNIHCRVINAKSFVPQNRERIFIAGFKDGDGFDFENLIIPDSINGPRLLSVLHPEDGTEAEDKPYTDRNGRVSDKYTLTAHLWDYLQRYAAKHQERGNGFGFGLVGPSDVARTLSARYYKDGSEILVRQAGGSPRRLTPRECARLMGFEQPGKRDFLIPVSDTQAYRQFGNAVVVPVAKAIAQHMSPWITNKNVKNLAPKRKFALVA